MHIVEGLDCAFFAVLDGHAGAQVAEATQKTLVATVLNELALSERAGSISGAETEKALKKGFLVHDKNLAADGRVNGTGAGCTCVSVLVTPSHLTFANLGDSRAIFVRDGRLQQETADHKPALTTEMQRVYGAGGIVLRDRIDGTLAVSRSFGDFDFKQRSDLPLTLQKVSPEPDTFSVPRSAGSTSSEFVLLACDGVWDVMTSRKAAAFVHSHLARLGSPALACEALVRQCFDRGSEDNISAMLIVVAGPMLKTTPTTVLSNKPRPSMSVSAAGAGYGEGHDFIGAAGIGDTTGGAGVTGLDGESATRSHQAVVIAVVERAMAWAIAAALQPSST